MGMSSSMYRGESYDWASEEAAFINYRMISVTSSFCENVPFKEIRNAMSRLQHLERLPWKFQHQLTAPRLRLLLLQTSSLDWPETNPNRPNTRRERLAGCQPLSISSYSQSFNRPTSVAGCNVHEPYRRAKCSQGEKYAEE